MDIIFMIRDIKIIVIGGSAGSYSVVKRILSSISERFELPVVLCLHRLKDVRNGFAESLNIDSRIPVIEPLDKTDIRPGIVYLSPANYHLLVEPSGSIALSTEPDVNYSRPSIDVTMKSAGFSFREGMSGILLSGTNSDGARGLQYAFGKGAYTIVQDPENAQFRTMPDTALKYFEPHKKLSDDSIIEFLNSLKYNRYA